MAEMCLSNLMMNGTLYAIPQRRKKKKKKEIDNEHQLEIHIHNFFFNPAVDLGFI